MAVVETQKQGDIAVIKMDNPPVNALPVAGWFRGELLPFTHEVLSPERVRAQGLLDPDAVTAVIDTHVSGREDLSRNIWGLICFSLWHDRYAANPAGVGT